MNILFVNNIPFNPIGGGLERVTDILTKELIKRGYCVYYLCGKLPPSCLFLLNYKFPVKLYQLPNYNLFGDKDNIAFYEKLQADLSIDIVVNQRGLGGWFNKLLSITHTRIISVIHSTPEGDIEMLLKNLQELTVPPFIGFKKFIKKRCSFIVSFYWKKKAMRETRFRYNELAQFSDAIVTLSDKDIAILNNYIDVSHTARIVSIPNPNTFSVIDVSLNAKSKIVLYVGRLSKNEKEPLRLLKIWKILHEKYSDWQLKIVGDGDELETMENFVQLNCLRNVFFEGRQSEVAGYYREASFVCLTSNFEGWGMALTEGMQYGCIPFTFNNFGAAYEIIDDGLNECLIPAFNLNKYALRLSELMSDENKRFQMSRAAMEKVKKFSIENVVDQWEELILNL